ncbi:MAG: ATP-dependent DNA helicase UvrD2 [Acidimicrobiia bacterium]
MDDLLHGLDATQRDAVTATGTPLAILAGAGSGKTRVLTRRIAWQALEGATDPRHVLAVTFTRKAAGELRSRLASLGVQQSVTAGTFHAIALAQLRKRVDDAGRTMPTLLERKVRILLPLMGGVRGREAALAAADVASEIEWAKASLVSPDRYPDAATAAGRNLPRPAEQIAEIFKAYEKDKRKRGLVDFDDLISGCADAFARDPEFAAAQRWRFRHLYVDEFQDASPSQFRLLRAWLGDGHDLCVVGDGDQAIYGFAGADPSFLMRFQAHFPAAQYPDVHVVRLGSNYRSSPQVVATATSVLGAPNARRPTVRAARPDGPVPTVTDYDSETAEAAGIATAVTRAHRDGVRWSNIAVLYRTNAQSAHFEEAFTRTGIPITVRGGTRFLDRPEVQVALEDLRVGARTAPGRTFEEHLTDLAVDAEEQSEERREHADALVRLGREYLDADGGRGSVDGFLGFLQTALRSDDSDTSRDDAVELLTFHRAKGLEFDTVFVAGVERGLVPISYAKTPDALDEEQRLLYVALSRAERALHVSWSHTRAIGLRTANRTASPWLTRVERAIDRLEGREAPDGASAAASIDAARRNVATARGANSDRKNPARDLTDVDRPLYEALVEWRRRISNASGAPAYVVFHDATLAAVAVARPRTPRDLLALSGVGPVKVERYGDEVLALVAAHPST